MPAEQVPLPQAEDEHEESPEPIQLTRAAILSAEDLPMERVDVPEWGGFVYVRTLTACERDEYENGCLVGTGRNREFSLRNIRARLAVLTVCDETGQALFTEADAEALGSRSAAALDRVFAVAQRLSGLSDEDVEELAKNSETIRGDSGSGESPSE